MIAWKIKLFNQRISDHRKAMRTIVFFLWSLLTTVIVPDAHAGDMELGPQFISSQAQGTSAPEGKTKSIQFITSLDYPPFNFLDDNGKLTGFNVYLAKAICAEMKIDANCTMQAMPFEELVPALQKGQGDAIIAGVAISTDAREKMNFSQAYLRFPARFISPVKSTKAFNFDAGLAGVKIGVVAGTVQEQMARSFFPAALVIGFNSEIQLFADLNAGKVDLAFGDAMRLAFWLGSSTSANCCKFASGNYYSDKFLGNGMTVAMRANARVLTDDIDSALKALQANGKINEIYLRFFPTGFY